MKLYRTIILLLLLCYCHAVQARAVTVPITKPTADTTPQQQTKKDSSIAPKKKHDPKIATRRSLIFPGLGQIYNREYWKLPIVYGALSIPTVAFIYNNTWYQRTKKAYILKFRAEQTGATAADTANLANIDPRLKNLSSGSLQGYRNEFRRDRDYSVLWFLIVWGLNVADATVFAHLKEFDVSDNLTMQVKPTINPLTKSNGVGIVFNLKQPSHKLINVK